MSVSLFSFHLFHLISDFVMMLLAAVFFMAVMCTSLSELILE